jgi:PAS domain S-box-containing protein
LTTPTPMIIPEELLFPPMSLWALISPNGHFTKFSPAWEKALGYSEDQLQHQPFFKWLHPHDLEKSQKSFFSLSSDLTSVAFLSRIKKTCGNYLWFDWSTYFSEKLNCIIVHATDVTEHSKASFLLRESEEILGIGSWEISLDSNELYWSEKTHQIHETDPKTYHPKLEDALRFCHPDSMPLLVSAVDDLMQYGKPYELELKFITAKNREIWVKLIAGAQMDGNLIVRCYGRIEDITHRIHLQQDEKKRFLQLDAFFDLSAAPLIIITENSKFKKVNAAFERLSGYSSEELIQLSVIDILHPQDIQKTAHEIQTVFRGKPAQSFENRMLTKSGEALELLWNASADPEHGLLYASAIDVTRERKTQKELHDVWSAIDSAAIVAITDRNGVLTEVNENFSRISGYSKNELIGKTHQILNSGAHPKSFFKDLWRTISQGDAWNGEICNRKKTGELYWVQTFISPLLDSDGKIERYLAIRFEITEQKRAEAKLQESSKMASLGEMAGSIAHEINNPLAIIQGKSHQTLKLFERGSLSSEELQARLKVIHSTTERIATIVRGLRSFSRNATADPFESTPIKEIVEDTLSLCQESFKNHDIDLQTKKIPHLFLECRGTEISQVLLNLLSNANDAVRNLDEKWVQLEVKADSKNKNLKIMVTDSGKGISKEILNGIMAPFFTTKEAGKGTGLGLSISKGIIESHNGKLFVDENHPNTRFMIELPLKQK